MLQGVGVSRGYGIGTAVVLKASGAVRRTVPHGTPAQEQARLLQAVHAFTAETNTMTQVITHNVGTAEAALAQAQLTMLSDPLMLPQMQQSIRNGKTAETAVTTVCQGFYESLLGVTDEHLRQRAADILDLQNRLLCLLAGEKDIDIAALPKGTVLVAKTLLPSTVMQIHPKHIAALVTETGGATSHSAILARALAIPAVFAVDGATAAIQNGSTVIADGVQGRVITAPCEEEINAYLKKQQAYAECTAKRNTGVFPTAANGVAPQRVYGNASCAADVASVLQNGGAGIGLFRTEYLYMKKSALPSEEEQFNEFAAAVQAADGKPVTFRTPDFGGEKLPAYLYAETEENPLLGVRGVRYCLRYTALFQTHLRALLRSAAYGNVKIMLPFVTVPDEIDAVRALLETCAASLKSAGTPCQKPPLGVMIETPSAVLLSDVLAKKADFFSVGTNDLTGYMMAADRGNPQVRRYEDVHQPAVLRAIQMTVQNAKAAGIPVAVCGEAAADPRLISRLISWGIDAVSVPPSEITAVQAAVNEAFSYKK